MRIIKELSSRWLWYILFIWVKKYLGIYMYKNFFCFFKDYEVVESVNIIFVL